MTDTQATKQGIDELKSRYENLNKRKIQAEANLENATRLLEDLKAQARREYGTDDIEALQKKLAEMEAENERRRASYQEALDRIETDLAAVEEQYKTVENNTGGR